MRGAHSKFEKSGCKTSDHLKTLHCTLYTKYKKIIVTTKNTKHRDRSQKGNTPFVLQCVIKVRKYIFVHTKYRKVIVSVKDSTSKILKKMDVSDFPNSGKKKFGIMSVCVSRHYSKSWPARQMKFGMGIW